MREGEANGALHQSRDTDHPICEQDNSLTEASPDQAVQAIENVRLFNVTKESLERQTATADVLKAMSSSAFEIGPVLETIVETATRLTKADWGNVFRVEGDRLRFVTASGKAQPAYVEHIRASGLALDKRSASGRAAVSRRTVHIPDVLDDPEYEMRDSQRLQGFRTVLAVPMVRDDTVIGTIAVDRDEARPFSEQEIALIETFASQAAIAFENTRLFSETKESLDQQTAVSEVLGSISRSAFDLRAVLDAATSNAMRLSGAEVAWMVLTEGERFRQVAIAGSAEDEAALLQRQREVPEGFEFTEGSIAAIAMTRAEPFEVIDLESEPAIAVNSGLARLTHSRSVLAVPMMREGRALGALIVARKTVRA